MVAARKLIVVMGQSNAGSPGIAANVTVVPGLTTPFAAVPQMERGSRLTPLEVVSDPASGSRSLGPRTVSVGAPYNVGTFGPELMLGRTLHEARPGIWAMGKVWVDGSGLENCWLPGGAYPEGGPPWYTQVVGHIQAMETAMDAQLAGISWFGGTTDALEVPDQDNHFANLITLFTALRAVSGWSQVAITVDQIHDTFISSFGGATVGGPKVRAAELAFVAAMPRSAIVATNDLALLPDNAHFADNSYAILGRRHGVKMLELLGLHGINGLISGLK